MKKYIFKVICAGAIFTTFGTGYNADQGMMDACERMSQMGDYPEDDIEEVELVAVEDRV